LEQIFFQNFLKPILVKLDTGEKVLKRRLFIPLFSPNVKELMLGAEGDKNLSTG